MRTLVAITAASTVALAATPAAADSLAYLRASSQLERVESAKRYHPLNLIDDDPTTAWCEAQEGLGEGEEIRFFFKKSQRVDRIVIGPATISGRIISIVKITDGVNTVQVKLSDVYSELTLKRPLNGTTYTVSIEEVGGPNKGAELSSDVACLAEVLFYYKRRPFGGKTPLSRLRYNVHRDKILGRWAGEPLGAPEGFITFALDGTWEWKYVPLLGGRSERRTGEYRFRGNRLLMRRGETGRWSDMRFKYRRVTIDPDEIGAPRGNYEVISFNSAVGKEMGGAYNNAKF